MITAILFWMDYRLDCDSHPENRVSWRLFWYIKSCPIDISQTTFSNEFLNANCCFYSNFVEVPTVHIDNNSQLVHTRAWSRASNNLLSELMLTDIIDAIWRHCATTIYYISARSQYMIQIDNSLFVPSFGGTVPLPWRAIATQITSRMIVYSMVNSSVDQRKHQSSASLAFVRGIHRWPVNSPHKWPVTRKMFPFDDVIMLLHSVDMVLDTKYINLKSRLNFSGLIITSPTPGQMVKEILIYHPG